MRVVTVRMEEHIYQALERMAEARKAPVSSIVRDLIGAEFGPRKIPESALTKPVIDPLMSRMMEETLGLAAMICVVVQTHFGQSHPHLREKTISGAWAEATRLRTRVKGGGG